MRSTPILLGALLGATFLPFGSHAQSAPRKARSATTLTAKSQVGARSDAAKAAQVEAAYTTRVDVIATELKDLLTKVWMTSEEIKLLYGTPAQRARRPRTAEEVEQISKQQAELIAAVKEIRIETKRLRGISPVPRSLRRADNDLVTASIEMEQGLDSMVLWADTMSHEMGLQAARQLRKGSTSLYTGLKEIERRTDPVMKAKVYADD